MNIDHVRTQARMCSIYRRESTAVLTIPLFQSYYLVVIGKYANVCQFG